jgi:hypothetical protein
MDGWDEDIFAYWSGAERTLENPFHDQRIENADEQRAKIFSWKDAAWNLSAVSTQLPNGKKVSACQPIQMKVRDLVSEASKHPEARIPRLPALK